MGAFSFHRLMGEREKGRELRTDLSSVKQVENLNNCNRSDYFKSQFPKLWTVNQFQAVITDLKDKTGFEKRKSYQEFLK